MDTKTDGMIPEYGDLAILSKHRILVGAKQIRKALLEIEKSYDTVLNNDIACILEIKGIANVTHQIQNKYFNIFFISELYLHFDHLS